MDHLYRHPLAAAGRSTGATAPIEAAPEIGPHTCPLCGGWMWVAPPAWMPAQTRRTRGGGGSSSRQLQYRCNRCHVSRSYALSEDGTAIAVERR